MFKVKTILKVENAYQDAYEEELELEDGVSIAWN